ncbi:hypothetical protein J4032_20915 [Streptomyces formicae]|uniref:Mobile element protein n=1 Tax=Streptomyces formicae TaxID=1616117 RepID=A0ABY3WQ58_9ACTN|nr:hypothetical protein [Streptomyces formicae]UNM13599.1 hypothetical protein J4032_20915 [Streptomyces formicae]
MIPGQRQISAEIEAAHKAVRDKAVQADGTAPHHPARDFAPYRAGRAPKAGARPAAVGAVRDRAPGGPRRASEPLT